MATKKDEKHVTVSSSKNEPKSTEIAPWRPDPLVTDLDRFFDDFRAFESPFAGGWLAPRRRLLQALSEIRHPYADLIDSGHEFRVVAEVPGIPKEKLDITVTERSIKIEGEAKTDIKEEKEGYVRRERAYSKVSRTLAFPEPVIPGKAEATVNNGLLEVRVPKKAPTKTTGHKVAVK